jgi:putative alpha-1,2-mannosidase
MGFYPVSPGVPVYDLGSPVFDCVTVRLQNGRTLRVVARNNSKSNKYVQSFRLNGRPQKQVWFRHEDIANGGTLELQMSDTPNTVLGSDPIWFPPSALALDSATLAGVR